MAGQDGCTPCGTGVPWGQGAGGLSTCFSTSGEPTRPFSLHLGQLSPLYLALQRSGQIHSKTCGIQHFSSVTHRCQNNLNRTPVFTSNVLVELVKYNVSFLTAKNLPGCKHGPGCLLQLRVMRRGVLF